jgi:hypothetical protein
MISSSEYKKILGDEARGLSDIVIEQIKNDQYRFAELAFEILIKQKDEKLSK